MIALMAKSNWKFLLVLCPQQGLYFICIIFMFNMEFRHLPNLSIQIVHTLTPLEKKCIQHCLGCFHVHAFVVVVVVVDCSGIISTQSSTNQGTQISKTTKVIIVIYTIYLLKKETLNVSKVY